MAAYDRITRRRALRLAGGVTAAVVLDACAGNLPAPPSVQSGTPAATPAAQQIFATVVHGNEPRSLDSLDMVKTTQNITQAIFDRLVDLDPMLKPIPGIAERWERTGELTWRAYIRKGVKFHNGEDVDADSVVFSIDTFKNCKCTPAPFWAPVTAKAIDKQTVELSTQTPNATIGDLMTYMFVSPKEYYSKVGATEFARHPIGSGAFEFVEWEKGTHITVKRNDNYWKGPAKVSALTFKWAAEASTRVAMLESGAADIVVDVPVQMFGRVKAAGHQISSIRSMRKMFFEMNMFQPPFNDIRLRRAVLQAVDVDELLKTLLVGVGVRSPQINSTYLPAWNQEFKPVWNYDPDAAKKWLAEAGRPGGFTAEFYHPVGRYPLDKEVAEAIAGQLSKVGIDVKLKGMETGAFFSALGANTMGGMHLLSVAPNYPHEDFTLRDSFYSKGHYHYLNSPEVDRMIEEYAEISDMPKRIKAYQDLEVYILNNLAAFMPMYDLILNYGVHRRMQFTPRPDETMDLRMISAR